MAEAVQVGCIGGGLIGRAWAIVYARAGHECRVFDASPGAAEAVHLFAAEVLPGLADEGLLDGAEPNAVLSRIVPVDRLEDAVCAAGHVQESTPERLETKKEVFATLDELVPDGGTIASSSSALLPSSFTADLRGRHRCLVAHPINPPYLVPAVEVVPAEWTDRDLRDRVAALLRAAGMAPIVMERELDGFVMNRMQGALLEEAFRLVADGYASVEDVDIGIRDGLALRWSFMGPFETIDLNAPGGVRDYAERYEQIYARLFPSMQRRVEWTGPVMERIEADRRESLPADKLAERQIWRDRRLMALVAQKRRAGRDMGD